MTNLRTFQLAASAALLAGCTGDNPENVPLYGEWQMVTRPDRVSVDGRLVPPAGLPGQIKALASVETICGEPMFIDREWQEDEINRLIPGECTIERYEVSPERVLGSGSCANIAPQADFRPAFTVDISQSPQRYLMKLELKGDATIPGAPGRHEIRVSAVQDGTRVGDC